MIVNILMIIAGVVLVLWGADRLTDGAVALAERMQIPQIVIGLTIVALGTSAPEFCVSLVSALKGTADLAVGNVVGSNIFNTMLIVGVAAMVAPMTILPSTIRKDVPVALVASVALTVMVLMDGDLSRVDAALLFVGFLAFMWITLRGAKGSHAIEQEQAAPRGYSVLKSLLLLVLGLACLVVGSNIFVDGATSVAQTLGVSEAVIGLTIVAGGTSLPELATSVVAARKGNSGIAIRHRHRQCAGLQRAEHPAHPRCCRSDLPDAGAGHHARRLRHDDHLGAIAVALLLHKTHRCPLGGCRAHRHLPRLYGLARGRSSVEKYIS